MAHFLSKSRLGFSPVGLLSLPVAMAKTWLFTVKATLTPKPATGIVSSAGGTFDTHLLPLQQI
jgi:hypothetical protein